MNIHIVRKGDSLWAIARQYRTSVNQIISANQLDQPDVLVVGQALVIPSPMMTHTVSQGETLGGIASRYGVTVQALVTENQLIDASRIYPGQLLTVPITRHTVQAGETLAEIARRYGTTVQALARINGITNPQYIAIGQIIRIPERIKPIKEVNAFITRMDQRAIEEVRGLGKYLTYLSPFTYSVRTDGSLTQLQESSLLEAAREQRITPLLVLTNFSEGNFSSDAAAAILRNPTLQDQVITNILRVSREKGYAGLNIDFEYIYSEDRENYNAFLRRIVARLRPLGLLVSTSLAPKVSAEQKGILYEAHDYEAHGKIVDFVVLMTYEWGWAGGRPLAIAPINQVRRVLDYAVTVIPRNKIMMGAPLYGRDWNIPWVQGTRARTVSPRRAIQLAAKYRTAIQYQETYQAPFFRYTDENGQEHEVWFEDARSAQAKFDTVKQYGLRGISYWVLGSPFPENWPVQDWNFTARKRI
ncbi:spore gernimation protein [Bacillus sp. FJAT-27231]|uniref:LysM peptidoglycan-binding domain-containing protein n=1 Tax=Bacillus sp. FJAT-27231 TaxID=1679168 RepID=UPI000670FF4B|nr:LysM peptidoglycan-binding domain-containing protein [Bacillus sp. FJAT-27231]KMY54151.1 spore gernimation protein [Bacillus sp. FJAT-27231]